MVPLIDRDAFRFALNAKDDSLSDTCVTLDNIAVRVASSVRWRVVRPQDAAYQTADVAELVVGVVRSAQRQWIGERAWNNVRENTRELEAAVGRAARDAGAGVGVGIEAVEVRSLERAG